MENLQLVLLHAHPWPARWFPTVVLPTGARLSFLGWNGSLLATVLGRALKRAASSCCFCSSFIWKNAEGVYESRRFLIMDEIQGVLLKQTNKQKKRCCTICSQRLLLAAPRSSMSSLKGSGLVGSSFFFSGRTTVSKSGSGWALNCGTWGGLEKTPVITQRCTLDVLGLVSWKLDPRFSPPHFASPPVSSPSTPASRAPAPQRRTDRPPPGGALVGGAGRGGRSGAPGEPWLVRAVSPEKTNVNLG